MRAIFPAIKHLIIFILPSILTVGLLIVSIKLLSSSQQSVFLISDPQPTPESANAQGNNAVQTIESISRQAIETSNRTLQVVQWLVPIFVLSLIGVATNIAMSFSSTLKDATVKLSEMGRKYELVTQEFEKTHKELEKITNNYLNLQQDFVSVESQTLPFDLATKAYESGRIDRQKYVESQAWYSWQKWKFGGDETGYEELLFHKKAQKGLPKSIVRSAIAELIDVNAKINTIGAATDQDYKNRSKLLRILNLPES
jgi:hypothetical protein